MKGILRSDTMRVGGRRRGPSHVSSSGGSTYPSTSGLHLLENLVATAVLRNDLHGGGGSLQPLRSSSMPSKPPAKPGRDLDSVVPKPTSTILQDIWGKYTGDAWCEPNSKPLDEEYLQDRMSFGPCQLHAGGTVHRVHPNLEPFLADTFRSVRASMNHNGYATELSRFDLFHGHVFQRSIFSSQVALVGILFHCAEYPAVHPSSSTFEDDHTSNENGEFVILKDVDLGLCQLGSTCHPTLDEWRFRNVLWSTWWPLVRTSNNNNRTSDEKQQPMNVLTGSLSQAIWLLDGLSPEVAELRVDCEPFGPNCPNTVFEGFLGDMLGDIYYLNGDLFLTAIHRRADLL